MSEKTPVIGHYIDGGEVFEGDLLRRENPADSRETVAEYHNGTAEIMDRAVAAARDAFPKWAKLTRRDRAEVVARAAALLDTPEWSGPMRDAMIDEIGKTTAGANGEVAKTRRIFSHMAGLGTHTPDEAIHGDQQGVDMFTKSEPVGVAGLVTPFNFPLAVPAWKIAPALIAGCTVVVKPSPAAPMTSDLLMRLFQEAMSQTPAVRDANIGPGVLNMVMGGPEVVKALIENRAVEAVSFTGSTEAGTSLLRLAINRPIPLDPRHFVAEMGGQNALVVLEDGDVDQAVAAAVNGAYFGEGQRCTATSRFVVEEKVYDQFKEKLLARASALRVGPGRDPRSEVGPLVSNEAALRVAEALSRCARNGMDLLHGGRRLMEGDLQYGNFLEPTLFEGDPWNEGHAALREEIFGPVAGICSVKDLDEALAVVNNTVKHRHAASIFTQNLRAAFEFAERAKVGMVHANNPTMGGDPQGPFGGSGGATSFGPREMGLHCMDPFLRDKTIDINWGGGALGRGAR